MKASSRTARTHTRKSNVSRKKNNHIIPRTQKLFLNEKPDIEIRVREYGNQRLIALSGGACGELDSIKEQLWAMDLFGLK